MDDDREKKEAMELVNNIVASVLDGVAFSIATARSEVQNNPVARPRWARDDEGFAIAADFGLFVALTIVQKITAAYREGHDRQYTVN